MHPLLIIFSGLPGTGKSAIASELARRLDAVYLRIDSIEQAIRDSGVAAEPLNDAGYRVAYIVAENNLRLGRTVIADSVNPLAITRDAWLAVAGRASARAVEIEVKCSDPVEHRRRVETRTTDIPGLQVPAWHDVLAREYQPWDRDHLVLDTAVNSVGQCVEMIQAVIE